MGVISNCREQCIHYWVCKNKEKYEQTVNDKLEINIKQEIPEFVDMITEVSLLCKNQEQPKYNNNAPKYRAIDDRCDECKHKNVCLNKDGYQKLINELANSNVRFSIHCPYLSLKTKEELDAE